MVEEREIEGGGGGDKGWSGTGGRRIAGRGSAARLHTEALAGAANRFCDVSAMAEAGQASQQPTGRLAGGPSENM